MLDLTTAPPSCSTSTIWRRVPSYILPNITNGMNDFAAPPRDMLHLSIDAAIHHPLLVAAC
jgi:hypothetical protein